MRVQYAYVHALIFHELHTAELSSPSPWWFYYLLLLISPLLSSKRPGYSQLTSASPINASFQLPHSLQTDLLPPCITSFTLLSLCTTSSAPPSPCITSSTLPSLSLASSARPSSVIPSPCLVSFALPFPYPLISLPHFFRLPSPVSLPSHLPASLFPPSISLPHFCLLHSPFLAFTLDSPLLHSHSHPLSPLFFLLLY